MCGILGSINFSDTPYAHSEDDFNSSLALMSHRGPDAKSQWLSPDGSARLAHLRLSILDLSPDGTQPMHLNTAIGNLTIIFNGEVFNYLELRETLTECGYSFVTNTDTEVILAAYAAWGDNCLQRFNGMYSIAIFNDKTQTLWLARDRLGIKPLYYHIKDETIIFASEVKAIVPLLNSSNEIDPLLIHEYMKYGYIPGDRCLNKDIFRLLPGHYMTIKLSNNKMTTDINCYWDIANQKPLNISFDEASTMVENVLSDSISLRMRSDVPVGVFLSGGLDSSAVVALLSKQNHKIKTFSVRYDIGDYGEEYDESKYAELVSSTFNTEHKTYTMTAEDFKSYIPKLVQSMDEPVTEAAAISLHYLAEMAKEDVTVVLSGEGADEIFAGYDSYRYHIMIEKIRNTITAPIASICSSLAKALLPQGNKLRKYIELTGMTFEQRYHGISYYDQSHMELLCRKEILTSIRESENTNINFSKALIKKSRGKDILARMLDFDTKTWLVDDLLIKADRMSMSSSLELRVPFLDYRLVELATQLPSKFKIHKNIGKYILKKIMEKHLPTEIIYRPKKGFPTPLALMFRGPLKEYVLNALCPENKHSMISQYFNHDYVAQLCTEHFAKTMDHHRILWQLVVLEEWLQQNTQQGV
jgi:asparagine synthase (glutamine-hydrolysing)